MDGTIKRIAVAMALLGGVLTAQQGFAQQGLNNLWMGGYNNDGAPPWGGVDVDFFSGQPVISTQPRSIGFGRASANITDPDGHLLFSTNGVFIANALGDTMLNGSGLAPSNYASNYPEGSHAAQAALILPTPENPQSYYVFHGTVDDMSGPIAEYLYASTIDMTLDGGLGGVVSKNAVLIDDALNVGKITAVKHANGRDWWVICHQAHTSVYYRILVTPEGIGEPQMQTIATVRPGDAGQVCFSPDGTKFAYYWGPDGLDILTFDRCMGLFSAPVFIDVNGEAGLGIAFSPNSRFLYVSDVSDVYQIDTHATDMEGSMQLIATWDGFYSPSPPFATMFDIAQLAPDGRIYISTGNSTFHMHVIEEPDLPGLACGMVQHGMELPLYYQNSLPNHPNYHLGPLEGSPCDTLILEQEDRTGAEVNITAYPNPSAGRFALNYPAQPGAGELRVHDVHGRLILQERLPAWSQVHGVELPQVAPGVYQCSLAWAGPTRTVRIAVE